MTPIQNTVALEAHLRAIENLCNLSLGDTTEVDPREVLYHIEVIRQNISAQKETFESRIELTEFANHIAEQDQSAYSKFRALPGESALDKATFVYSLITDYETNRAAVV